MPALEKNVASNESEPQFTPCSVTDVFLFPIICGAYACAVLAIGQLILLFLVTIFTLLINGAIIPAISLIIVIGAVIFFTGGIALYVSGIVGFLVGGVVGGIAGLLSGIVNALIYTLSDTDNQYNEVGLPSRLTMAICGGGIFYIAGAMLSESVWVASEFDNWLVWLNNIGFTIVGAFSSFSCNFPTEVRDKSESEDVSDVSLLAPLNAYFRLGEACSYVAESAIDFGATVTDDRTVIKQGGKTYRKDIFGQWKAEKGFLGRDKVERDWKGAPVVKRDWKGDEKIERDWKGDAIIPPD